MKLLELSFVAADIVVESIYSSFSVIWRRNSVVVVSLFFSLQNVLHGIVSLGEKDMWMERF